MNPKINEIYTYGDIKVTLEGDCKFLYIGDNLRNGKTQSVIYPDRPQFIDWFYPHGMLAPMLLTGVPKKILVIGLGGGMLVRMLRPSFPDMEIVVVEISADVIQAAKDHFQIDDYDFRLIHQDAFEFLQQTDEQFDWIISDAFWVGVVPITRLNNPDVFQLMKSRLSTNGSLIVNVVFKARALELALGSVFKHNAIVDSGDKTDTHLIVGFNFEESKSWTMAQLESARDWLITQQMPCNTDWKFILESLLRKTPHTSYRLTL